MLQDWIKNAPEMLQNMIRFAPETFQLNHPHGISSLHKAN